MRRAGQTFVWLVALWALRTQEVGAKQRQILLEEECGQTHTRSSVETLRGHFHRISGGFNIRPGEYPSFVTVKFEKLFSVVSCGGVLISRELVLTAAHCLQKNVQRARVSLGVRGFDQWDEDSEHVYKADLACVSPYYQTNPEPMYDFAVVRLSEMVTLSDKVQVACLPTKPIAFGAQAYAVGAGYVDETGEHPRVAKVLPVNRIDCGSEEHETRICFRSNQRITTGDTCQGDSGGPIYAYEDGKQTVYGLTSYGPSACRAGRVSSSINGDVFAQLNHILDFTSKCLLENPRD